MARINNLTNFLTDVASAIKTKKGDSTPILASNFDTEIANLPSGATLQSKSIEITQNGDTTVSPDTGYDGLSQVAITTNVSGGGGLQKKDVNYIDYDGTVLFSYTKTEFLALTTEPTQPNHTGLVKQGWNWSLADAKTFVTNNGGLDIGGYYSTNDGKTRIYIEITDTNMLSLTLNINARKKGSSEFGYNQGNTVTIAWGDGTTSSITATSTSATQSGAYKDVNHTYSTIGNYVISIEASLGVAVSFDKSGYCSTILRGQGQSKGEINSCRYLKMIKKIELGDLDYNGQYSEGEELFVPSFYIKGGAFCMCSELESISISKNTAIASSGMEKVYDGCFNIKNILIPRYFISLTGGSATSLNISSSMFSNCPVEEVIFPSSNITITGANVFSNMSKLKRIIVPTASVVDFKSGGDVLLEKIIINSGGSITMSNTISSSFNANVSLINVKKIIIGPFSSFAIANNGLTGYTGLEVLDFSRATKLATMSGASLSAGILNPNLKIIVPDSLYADWIADSYWSTYSSYIVKASQA